MIDISDTDIKQIEHFETLSFKFRYFSLVIDYGHEEVEVSFNSDIDQYITHINYEDLREESKIVEQLELTIQRKLIAYTNLVN